MIHHHLKLIHQVSFDIHFFSQDTSKAQLPAIKMIYSNIILVQFFQIKVIVQQSFQCGDFLFSLVVLRGMC